MDVYQNGYYQQDWWKNQKTHHRVDYDKSINAFGTLAFLLIGIVYLIPAVAALVLSSQFEVGMCYNPDSGYIGSLEPNTWLYTYGLYGIIGNGAIIVISMLTCCSDVFITMDAFVTTIYLIFWLVWGIIGTLLFFIKLIPCIGDADPISITILVIVALFLIELPALIAYIVFAGGWTKIRDSFTFAV